MSNVGGDAAQRPVPLPETLTTAAKKHAKLDLFLKFRSTLLHFFTLHHVSRPELSLPEQTSFWP